MKIARALILLLCLTGTFSWGQSPYFQQYYPLNKTQPVQVNTLLQDRSGFIWLGTDKGLFRFDGRAFQRLTSDDTLADNHITALAQDSLGRLWMGHQNGTISFVKNGRIHPFEAREGSAVEPVSDILFDKRGVMWFSTKNDGLYYFLNDRLYRVDQDEGLPDLFIYDLFEDRLGRVWAGTDAGIAVCSLEGADVKVDVIDSNDGLSDIIIRKIRAIDNNVIALATEDVGLLSYDMSTNKINPLANDGWQFGAISDFVVKEEQLWIALPRHGLMSYDRVTGRQRVFTEFQRTSLSAINCLLKDEEGNIWSGLRSGIVRTMGDGIEHLEVVQPGADNNVLAVAVDLRGRTWFSTSDGLFVKEGSSVVAKKLPSRETRNAPVISLYIDPEGYVWAGLYGSGLLRIHPDNNEVKHFKQELRNGNILGITGRGDKVWAATLGGASMIRFRNGEYTIRNYSSSDGLSSDFIYQVFIDSRERTWFATDGKGVTMLDDKGFHHYGDGLPSQVVYSVAEDADGNIWVSAQNNGVFMFSDGKFSEVADVRLRDHSVQSLVGDKHGNLIAFHNYGVDVYDVRRKQMRYWGEESGIRDKEPNLNASTVDQYGQVYAGTTRGILKFSLNNDRIATTPKPTIHDFSIFGQSYNIEADSKLRYNENNVTIHYLGFWYQNPLNLNFLYKLENYDVDWISTRNLEVTYSRLPPGEYTFRVKVSETDDFSNAKEASVSFVVSPPFWRTAPFYLLIIALILISGYGFIKYREKSLLEDKLILEAKVEERTREIQLKNEEIQAQNEEIMAQAEEIQGINENLEMLVKQRTAELEKKNKALEEYAFINAHKLRSPVASILGLVNLLAKAEHNEEEAKIVREHLQESADKLDEVVRSITKAIERADNKYL
jgi:ligand-binding sensor domain-containing protein